MRFNTCVVTTAYICTASVSAFSTGNPDYCTEEVIVQAAQEGFLEFVVLNCVSLTTHSGANWLDETVVTPSECLSSWIKDHQSGSPIPSSGDCRDTYQDFVDCVAVVNNLDEVDSCRYDTSSGSLDVTEFCAMNHIVTCLSDFRESAGDYVGGQQCSAVTVRTLSNRDAYGQIVSGAFNESGPLNPVADMLNPVIDGGNGLCYYCYYSMFNHLVSSDATSEGLDISCRRDPLSDSCMQSTIVQNALAEFAVCSGGFQLIFDGPVCTWTDIEEVQQLIPSPYYTLSHCAFNPAESFCSTTGAYIAQIKAESDSSCVLCYQDFFAAAMDEAKNAKLVSACTGPNGVWGQSCIVAVGVSLLEFEACAGYKLSTARSSYNAPIVASVVSKSTAAVMTSAMAAALFSVILITF